MNMQKLKLPKPPAGEDPARRVLVIGCFHPDAVDSLNDVAPEMRPETMTKQQLRQLSFDNVGMADGHGEVNEETGRYERQPEIVGAPVCRFEDSAGRHYVGYVIWGTERGRACLESIASGRTPDFSLSTRCTIYKDPFTGELLTRHSADHVALVDEGARNGTHIVYVEPMGVENAWIKQTLERTLASMESTDQQAEIDPVTLTPVVAADRDAQLIGSMAQRVVASAHAAKSKKISSADGANEKNHFADSAQPAAATRPDSASSIAPTTATPLQTTMSSEQQQQPPQQQQQQPAELAAAKLSTPASLQAAMSAVAEKQATSEDYSIEKLRNMTVEGLEQARKRGLVNDPNWAMTAVAANAKDAEEARARAEEARARVEEERARSQALEKQLAEFKAQEERRQQEAIAAREAHMKKELESTWKAPEVQQYLEEAEVDESARVNDDHIATVASAVAQMDDTTRNAFVTLMSRGASEVLVQSSARASRGAARRAAANQESIAAPPPGTGRNYAPIAGSSSSRGVSDDTMRSVRDQWHSGGSTVGGKRTHEEMEQTSGGPTSWSYFATPVEKRQRTTMGFEESVHVFGEMSAEAVKVGGADRGRWASVPEIRSFMPNPGNICGGEKAFNNWSGVDLK